MTDDDNGTRRGRRNNQRDPRQWRVFLSPTGTLLVTAERAGISTQGVLLFRTAKGDLVKALAAGEWATVEMLTDPYDNEMMPLRAADPRA
jgi:hypothetical protein